MDDVFSCPECGQKYRLTERIAGRMLKCKKCQAVIKVPVLALATAPAASDSTIHQVTIPPELPETYNEDVFENVHEERTKTAERTLAYRLGRLCQPLRLTIDRWTKNNSAARKPTILTIFLMICAVVIVYLGVMGVREFTGPPSKTAIEIVIRAERESTGVTLRNHLWSLQGVTIRVEIQEIGVFNKKENYWPVRAVYSGTGYSRRGLEPETKRYQFRGAGVFAIYRDDFGKLRARQLRSTH